MVSTLELRPLVDDHRRNELRLRKSTFREMASVWRANVDPEDPVDAIPGAAVVLTDLVHASRKSSSDNGISFYREMRSAAGVAGRFSPGRAPDIPNALLLETLTRSARSVALAALGRGYTRPEASRKALLALEGRASRYVANGSRDSIGLAVSSDPRARGYERVTSDDPCPFCALMASRGPVYKSEQAADFEAHDFCQCHTAPAFEGTTFDPDPIQAEAQRLYREMDGSSLSEFRKVWRNRQSR